MKIKPISRIFFNITNLIIGFYALIWLSPDFLTDWIVDSSFGRFISALPPAFHITVLILCALSLLYYGIISYSVEKFISRRQNRTSSLTN